MSGGNRVGRRTNAEWRERASAAQAALAIDSARQYGLVTGGPLVNIDVCVQTLETAKRKGIHPDPVLVDAYIKALVSPEIGETDGQAIEEEAGRDG